MKNVDRGHGWEVYAQWYGAERAVFSPENGPRL
jgi:hypothetical protein